MKLTSIAKIWFNGALFSVLGIAIAVNCGCKQTATNSNTTTSDTPSATAAQDSSATPASTPSASAEDARQRRESGRKNDAAGAVGRPMNPDKFGPPK